MRGVVPTHAAELFGYTAGILASSYLLGKVEERRRVGGGDTNGAELRPPTHIPVAKVSIRGVLDSSAAFVKLYNRMSWLQTARTHKATSLVV